ncbi:MAG: phage N-6-adenine-methyltransferase [Deltaproteobacteria bacterium]|nr:phage N-6-adenine-methyltransferase [Deltaproteobacteria bacterium]
MNQSALIHPRPWNRSKPSDRWGTPLALFQYLDAVFRFELDVCALPGESLCPRAFTPEDDGLAQPWSGRIWMNPPYSPLGAIVPWVRKAAETAQAGKGLVMALLPARTDAGWWQDWVAPHADIRFLRGRLKFGGASNNAPFPSALALYWPRPRGCR